MSKILRNREQIIARLITKSASPLSIWFALEMQGKLDLNRHKGGWDLMTPKEILGRIKDEVAELEAAIEGGECVEIIDEAVDIANFCSFLAHNMQEDIESKESSNE